MVALSVCDQWWSPLFLWCFFDFLWWWCFFLWCFSLIMAFLVSFDFLWWLFFLWRCAGLVAFALSGAFLASFFSICGYGFWMATGCVWLACVKVLELALLLSLLVWLAEEVTFAVIVTLLVLFACLVMFFSNWGMATVEALAVMLDVVLAEMLADSVWLYVT